METELQDLLPKEILTKWYELTETIDSLYDVDKMWQRCLLHMEKQKEINLNKLENGYGFRLMRLWMCKTLS